MEHFFTSSLFQLFGRTEPAGYSKVELAVSIEAFFNHHWDWSDFLVFATGDGGEMWKIMLITKNTFIWVEDGNTRMHLDLNSLSLCQAIQRATFTAPSGKTHVLVLAEFDKYSEYESSGSCPGLLLTGANVFWRAATTGDCVKLKLDDADGSRGKFYILSETVLLQFLEASPSVHLVLEFKGFHFKEADCRALATLLESLTIEVNFESCVFRAQGAEDTFIEWLRHSQIVTNLDSCRMSDSIISALTGNSSIKRLTIPRFCDSSFIRSLAQALPGNQGIENLDVLSNDDYLIGGDPSSTILLLRSLWAHPLINDVSLVIRNKSAASKTTIMNEVLRLVQCNTVLHTIDLPDHAIEEEFFQNFIEPRLEMNRNYFEKQRRGLTKVDPSIRGQLLGRALHVVRYNPNLLFRFLSENVPAFVRSDEDGPINRPGLKRKARP